MAAPQNPPGSSGRFDYFVVRVHWTERDSPAAVAGIVERLGTGEKRTFENVLELAQYICEGPTISSGGSDD